MRLLCFLCLLLFSIFSDKSVLNPAVTLSPRTSIESLTDDMIRIPISVIKGMDNTKLHSSPYTIGAWIRPDFDTNMDGELNAVVLSANNNASSRAFDGGVTLSIDYSTRCLTVTGYSSLDIPENLGTTALINKEWQYVALCFNPTTHKITAYLDGKEELSVNYTNYAWCESNSPENLFFMVGSVGYNGAIDDIHISSNVLTPEQINLCIENKAEEVPLSGWYTLNDVVEGTTGEFANQISSSQVNAQYVTFQLISSKYYSYKKDTATEATPDLTSIDKKSQRLEKSAFTVVLPSISNFTGIKSLSFFDENGDIIAQNEQLSFNTDSKIYINVEAEDNRVIRTISVNNQVIENGGYFNVTSNLTPDDFVISTAIVQLLEVDVPEILKYYVKVDGTIISSPYKIAEGANVEITLQNANLFSNVSMKLNGSPITFASDGIVHFVMPSQDTKFAFTADDIQPVIISLQNFEGGEYTVFDGEEIVTDGSKLLPGSTLTIQSTPDSGYYLLGVKVDGNLINSETITVPSNDFYLSVDFRALGDYNKALTFKTNTTIACTEEDVIEIPAEAIGLSNIKSLETANFAAAIWLKQTQRISQGNMILLVATPTNYANTNPYLYFNTSADGEIQFSGSFSKFNLQNVVIYPTGKILPLNEWHQLAFNVDLTNSKVELYFDGEFVSAIENINVPQLTSQTEIKLYGGGLTFNGSFDEMQLFNQTLTTDAFKQLYLGSKSQINSLTADFDFQSTTNNNGTFANLVDQFPDYLAIYKTASGTAVDNGMSVQTSIETIPDLSTITTQTQRLTPLQSHDANIEAMINGNGTIETYVIESTQRRLLRDNEKIRNGSTMLIIAKPNENHILKSLKINGIEQSLSRTADETSINHTVNGDTKIEAMFVDKSTAIETIESNDSESSNSTYYTLTGLQVKLPLNPGIYLKKQNHKVTKILIK